MQRFCSHDMPACDWAPLPDIIAKPLVLHSGGASLEDNSDISFDDYEVDRSAEAETLRDLFARMQTEKFWVVAA